MTASSIIYVNETLGHACFLRLFKYCIDLKLFDMF